MRVFYVLFLVLLKASIGSCWAQGRVLTWHQNGSVVALEVVGKTHRFYYVQPRAGLPAKSGDTLFEGTREGSQYSGRAFLFSSTCEPISYPFSGIVSADETSVTMRGKKPVRDADCNVAGYVDGELVLVLADRFQRPEAVGATTPVAEELRATQEPSKTDPLTSSGVPVIPFVFAMPRFWILVPGKEIQDGKLLFRRFSVAVRKEDLDAVLSGKEDKLRMVGPEGSFFNSMIFDCQGDRSKGDFLTFHLPDQVIPTSFKKDEWVSKLELRLLVDNTSNRYIGEYIKGDIFLDANASNRSDFARLLFASNVIVEFGNENDRLNLFVADAFAKVNLEAFIRAAVPPRLSPNPGSVRILSSDEVLQACLRYKNTRKF